MSRHPCVKTPHPGLHPPRIGSNDDKLSGRRLLALVRLFEKEDEKDDKTNLLQQLLFLFKELSVIYSIRGLLQGDVSKAERILSTFGSNSAIGPRDKQNRKKTNASEHQSGFKMIHDNKVGNNGSNTELNSMDASLALSALVRVFCVPIGTTESADKWILIAFAANTCTSICERIKSLLSFDTCALAEFELISTHGKPLLVGLSKAINIILSASDEAKKGLSRTDTTTQCRALTSCLRSSASLMSLLGTKMSRNTVVLASLRQAGFQSLTWADSRTGQASASLIIATTLTGGLEKSSPSDLWNQLVTDCLLLMQKVLHALLPTKEGEKIAADNGGSLSTESQQLLVLWHNDIRQLPVNGEGRVKVILPILHGLTKLFCALFAPFAGDRGVTFQYVDANFSMQHMLDVVETMLSFPVTAESSFYSTKKRLRPELLEHGWLSPNTLVTQVANHVKLMGCEILEAVITKVGGPSMLTSGRRVVRMTYSALYTAMSSALRRVVDPVGSGRSDGKRQRWLHASIRLRAASIRAFNVVITAFGPNSVSCTMQRQGGIRGRDMVRAISLVAGSLLEQMTWSETDAGEGLSSDWGSIDERGELAREAADAITACLDWCGAFVPFETRSLIDSVILTSFSSLFNPRSVASWPIVKVAILRLANSCLTAPWPDGAASSLVKAALLASTRCALDTDSDVAAAAKETLRIIQTQVTPHAPPLLIVTRSSGSGPSSKKSKFQDISSASSMIDELGKSHAFLAQIEQKERASQEAVEEKLNSDGDNKRAKLSNPKQDKQHSVKEATQANAADSVITETKPEDHYCDSKDAMITAALEQKGAELDEAGRAVVATMAAIDVQAEFDKHVDDMSTRAEDEAAHHIANDLQSYEVNRVASDDEDEDDDFPMIVDVDPDADDM